MCLHKCAVIGNYYAVYGNHPNYVEFLNKETFLIEKNLNT